MAENNEEKFFFDAFKVDDVSEEDYNNIDVIVRIFKAVSLAHYQWACIFDFHRLNFLSVTPSSFTMLGLSHKDVESLGFAVFEKYIPQDKWEEVRRKINVARQKMSNIPMDEQFGCTCHFSIPIVTDRRKTLVAITTVPLAMSKSGNPWLVLGVCSLAPGSGVPDLVIKNNIRGLQMAFDLRLNKWTREENSLLTEEEKWIIRYSCQGMPNKNICEKLYTSENTVKWHRKKMFEKLGVETMPEATVCAEFYKLM